MFLNTFAFAAFFIVIFNFWNSLPILNQMILFVASISVQIYTILFCRHLWCDNFEPPNSKTFFSFKEIIFLEKGESFCFYFETHHCCPTLPSSYPGSSAKALVRFWNLKYNDGTIGRTNTKGSNLPSPPNPLAPGGDFDKKKQL